MMKKKYLSMMVLAIPSALLLTGCNVSDLVQDQYEQSASKSAKTSQEGVASGLLPTWVPDGGTDVKLEQRSTGDERIFVMDYSGELSPESCKPLKRVGAPSDNELAKGYAADPRTKKLDAGNFVTFRTLEADWWPQDAEQRTTTLCGRWWVHQDDGKLYAFAPDNSRVANAIVAERAESAKQESQ
ncbi:hypothetical protein [Glutamicibacter arilaitensis]|uniref:hypothetical protein n=1 Tax=Glutamicibacter arilaitensis TaxID=256701 RepID=UPI00384CFCAD